MWRNPGEGEGSGLVWGLLVPGQKSRDGGPDRPLSGTLSASSCLGVSGQIYSEPEPQAGQPCCKWGGCVAAGGGSQEPVVLTPICQLLLPQELLDATQQTLQRQIQTLVKE